MIVVTLSAVFFSELLHDAFVAAQKVIEPFGFIFVYIYLVCVCTKIALEDVNKNKRETFE